MARTSHPSKAQMNTHLWLEGVIAAASVIGLSASLVSLRMANRAAGQGAREMRGRAEGVRDEDDEDVYDEEDGTESDQDAEEESDEDVDEEDGYDDDSEEVLDNRGSEDEDRGPRRRSRSAARR